ncbi:MAG: hypothetical protein ACRD28_10420 [Acidobacteriaceae bacterium]
MFTGDITFLDLHAGLLAVVDPRDETDYNISFDPARFRFKRKLREGTSVKVTADFDGTRFVASEIQVK